MHWQGVLLGATQVRVIPQGCKGVGLSPVQCVLQGLALCEIVGQVGALNVASRHAHHIFQGCVGKYHRPVHMNHCHQSGQQIKRMKRISLGA